MVNLGITKQTDGSVTLKVGSFTLLAAGTADARRHRRLVRERPEHGAAEPELRLARRHRRLGTKITAYSAKLDAIAGSLITQVNARADRGLQPQRRGGHRRSVLLRHRRLDDRRRRRRRRRPVADRRLRHRQPARQLGQRARDRRTARQRRRSTAPTPRSSPRSAATPRTPSAPRPNATALTVGARQQAHVGVRRLARRGDDQPAPAAARLTRPRRVCSPRWTT